MEKLYQVKRITVQPDRLNHLGGNEYELVSLKRAVVDCAENASAPIAFRIIVDHRARTLTVSAKDTTDGAGHVARSLVLALRMLSRDKDVARLPPRWEDEDELIVCAVADADHVLGLLHKIRDLGGWDEDERPAARML
jgi:hypothetical protein